MKIIVDAFGGDNAPQQILLGCAQARESLGIDIVLAGDKARLEACAKELDLTQQLAKNQYFTQEQTVERKIAEVFMALTMEQHFSKRTILELYVNSIYFGDGYEGIGSASWGYFGKAPSALDADECTLLAGIPNAPSVYALSQNPGLARERQQEVLRKLVSYDYLGQDAAQHILGNLRALAA